MAHQLKQTILSIIPLYISKESQAFIEITEAIKAIQDDKFDQIINQGSFGIDQRIHELLDEVIFFLNRHYQINEEQGVQLDHLFNQIKHIYLHLVRDKQVMTSKIALLEDRVQVLEDDRNSSKKLRLTAEILTPCVKDIRSSMTNQHIPDNYYSRTIINACLLHLEGKSISWEISDFNLDNPQSNFDINKFNSFELIIQNYADTLRINYRILLDLLCATFDCNEIEHESIKKFLKSNSHINVCFNEYLASMDMVNVFNINEKLCLESLYRNYFLVRYHRIQ